MDWYFHPDTLPACLFVLVGFYMLIKGADLLVEGAVVIAKRFQMTPAVVGATVVAFGTSLPELVVSMGANFKAMLEGMASSPDGPAAIAVSNIVGSNIFNIGAILGITACLYPITLPKSIFKIDYPIMLGALLVIVVLSLTNFPQDMMIDRIEGAILFSLLILYTITTIKLGKVTGAEELEVEFDTPRALFFIVAGIILLSLGGDISLNGSISLARTFGLSERVIGLTVMAMGTSLPELATCIQAVKKNHSDIAVGNIIGSNIFNTLCILGLASLVIPLPVHQKTISFDYIWMVSLSLLLLPFYIFGQRIGRPGGVILVATLITYIGLLFI